jgi:hypothetical protein
LRKLGPCPTNTRDWAVSNHCEGLRASERDWISMVMGRGSGLCVAMLKFRDVSTCSLLLCANFTQIIWLWLRHNVHVKWKQKCLLKLKYSCFNYQYILARLSTLHQHWILFGPFIRSLGSQLYSTISLCPYTSFFTPLTFPLRSSGGWPHDCTWSTAEILCKWG